MAVYGLSMAMYSYVWLCRVMHGYVGLCMALQDLM